MRTLHAGQTLANGSDRRVILVRAVAQKSVMASVSFKPQASRVGLPYRCARAGVCK